MKILNVFMLLFLASYTLAADSGEYNIIGAVTKKGGGPLKGVKVLLKGKKDSTITGADGAFKLFSPVAIRLRASQTQEFSFKLQGNAVTFSPVAGILNGNVTILTGNGRCIASTDFSGLNPANEQIALPQLASGFNIVRVTVNNTVYTCQVIQSGGEFHLVKKHASLLSNSDFTLAKMAASTVVVDSIIATKEGFKEAVLPVESYTLSNVAIAMDSIVEVVGDIAWGKMENPTEQCKITGTLPEYSALKANPKLPDIFMKLDGTRIKSKSEWAWRREEIHQSVLKYIYGDKPIPPKGSVTGTVSTSSITVKVTEGEKTCTFNLKVDMNGATQPAPAIISYGGGASAPRGVAKITFTAIEVAGGTGDKSGPFYTFYGPKHPAGYMVAQAWQISRVIDLLEQKPEIIDPYRIGLTGCSRNGKGAFVGGVLDNRVALTIPVESGIGGAVALRLVEQIGGSEMPYHAISYVRWLSEVALGPFTNSNNASGDNTDRLPIDIHSAMALIAPRALYVVDNPTVNNLDARESWVTTSAAKIFFEGLGLGDHIAYVGAKGTGAMGGHCEWRSQYTSQLNAMVNKFLKGDTSAKTGEMTTDGTKPDLKKFIDWEAPTLDGKM